jgi:hypothetical protein
MGTQAKHIYGRELGREQGSEAGRSSFIVHRSSESDPQTSSDAFNRLGQLPRTLLFLSRLRVTLTCLHVCAK